MWLSQGANVSRTVVILHYNMHRRTVSLVAHEIHERNFSGVVETMVHTNHTLVDLLGNSIPIIDCFLELILLAKPMIMFKSRLSSYPNATICPGRN